MRAIRWCGFLIGLYVIYAVVMVVLHPRFIYPFADEPFELQGYERRTIGADGPVVYVHEGNDDAPLVIYFMGNAGALAYFWPALAHHRDAHRNVVAMAYPGGGGIAGAPSETRLKAEALAVSDAAVSLFPSAPSTVFVQGYSLGTGLALHVAAARDVDGVILSAPYARLCRLMARASYLPACWMPGVQRWMSDEDAARVTVPTLVVHGSADTLIPIEEGMRLAESLAGPVEFHVADGSGHGLSGGRADLPFIDDFISRLSAPSQTE